MVEDGCWLSVEEGSVVFTAEDCKGSGDGCVVGEGFDELGETPGSAEEDAPTCADGSRNDGNEDVNEDTGSNMDVLVATTLGTAACGLGDKEVVAGSEAGAIAVMDIMARGGS